MTEINPKRQCEIGGRKFISLESAAKAFGMSRNTLDYRLSKGWTPEQAVGIELRPSHAGKTPGIPVKVQGLEFSNIKQAAKHFGRSYTHIFMRLKQGATLEQALGLIKRKDSLQSEFPEITKQWHPEKNSPLTPDSVTPHSGQKVWWICGNGHEWKAVINSRTQGMGCPYCAGQRPTQDRNFAVKFPELVNEWDFEKNQSIRPENCSPRSKNKVWWICEKRHSWQATISNRTRKWKSTCPFCRNRKLGADNSLAKIRPDIAKEWHPDKNAPLTPNDVVAGGTKIYWWVCKHGHDWQASIGRRVFAGSGCSKCSIQTSRIEIAVYAEMIALFESVTWRDKIAGCECDIYLKESGIGIEIDGVYWHSRKPELELRKSKVFESAGLLLFRLREKGLHALSERDVTFKFSDKEFEVVSRLVRSLLSHAKLTDTQRKKLQSYIEGGGLINEKVYRQLVANLPAPPLDQSLAVKHPEVAKEWAYDLNAPLSPEHFRSQANKNVWWRCDKAHTWKTSINNRVGQGTGCPACPRKSTPVVTAENNLAFVFPDLAREWHQDKNEGLHPDRIRPKSNQKFWWRCAKGHEWQAAASSRAAGSGCPFCYGRFATRDNSLAGKYPELLQEWDYERNGGLSPFEITARTKKKVWWRCSDGHSWQTGTYQRTKLKAICPECLKARPRAKLKKYTIVEMGNIAAGKGGKCLSTEYKSFEVKLRWQCRDGHEWEARPHNIVKNHSWCPVCARKH